MSAVGLKSRTVGIALVNITGILCQQKGTVRPHGNLFFVGAVDAEQGLWIFIFQMEHGLSRKALGEGLDAEVAVIPVCRAYFGPGTAIFG